MSTENPTTIAKAVAELKRELERATSQHRPYHSAHEGFAVLLEEVDELKDHVWARAGARNRRAMRVEALQVACVAVRFAAALCEDDEPDDTEIAARPADAEITLEAFAQCLAMLMRDRVTVGDVSTIVEQHLVARPVRSDVGDARHELALAIAKNAVDRVRGAR